jgi:hypothetical protein
MATTCAASSRVNGSMTGSGSSGAAQVTTQTQRRIRLEQLVLHRLRQDRAERTRDAA